MDTPYPSHRPPTTPREPEPEGGTDPQTPPGEPVRLGDLLPAVYRQQRWGQAWRVCQLARDWPSIVGEQVAKLTEPAFFRQDVLWIHVQDAAWMHHMQFVKLDWLERINRALGEVTVTDLRWRLAPQAPDEWKRAPVRPRPIDPVREQAFLEQTETIADTNCRDALRRLWRAFAAYGPTR